MAFRCCMRPVVSVDIYSVDQWWLLVRFTAGLRFCKAVCVYGINQLEQCFRGGQNYRAWSHGISKILSPFGNAGLMVRLWPLLYPVS
ncbi:hypothetical protein F2Q70_00031275 [Brassica cretica]|uniref:Uncharacterized protein n=1 Tax=Brassica cretica TaxID=69181 RepID=A0A8S9H5J4_BRACR|nr:hypothetical protein F2Q70_00031275 [Brassica cretica]KAF2553845.1 hypothetical protein F2Q68_00035689 [Brassica cretica]